MLHTYKEALRQVTEGRTSWDRKMVQTDFIDRGEENAGREERRELCFEKEEDKQKLFENDYWSNCLKMESSAQTRGYNWLNHPDSCR